MDGGTPQRHDTRVHNMIAVAFIVDSIRVSISPDAMRWWSLSTNGATQTMPELEEKGNTVWGFAVSIKQSTSPRKKNPLTRSQRKHQELAPKVRPAASRARDWVDHRSYRRRGVPYRGRGA